MTDDDINIKKVLNGYILSWYDETSEETKKYVVEISDEEVLEIKAEQIALAKVIYKLRDLFDVHNDKHKDQYMDIKISGEDT